MECTVHTVTEAAPKMLSLPEGSCAEDAVLAACRSLRVAPITRHLFALRERQSSLFLADAARIQAGLDYELRIRFKVLNLHHLRGLDGAAYDYYFRQARGDVFDNSVPEIEYAKHKKELLGLGIADMYRAIQEDNKSLREVERNYKKYIPKEIIRKHQFFTKKPIHNTLEQWCQKVVQNPSIIKAQYLEQLTRLAPNYLSEEYSVQYMPFGGQYAPARLELIPYHHEQPGLRLFDDIKKKWIHICTMEQLIFLGRKTEQTKLEVCRKNGVPVYLRFGTARETSSFISGCGGYYRLMVKWTFSLSKDDPTPSLERLYNMNCHGPVGGEFSYHKLAEKGGKRHGCYILRQCQHDYDVYYIDVCTKNNTTETYKVEFKGHCYIFNSDEARPYNSIEYLIRSFSDPEGRVYLKDCLPPSEYDKSQLLLCGEQYKVGVRIDQAELQELLKHHKSPRCINTRDMLIFKGPWCYNELADDDNIYVKRYCDVPLCDDRDCELFTRPTAYYSHYITLNSSWSNLEFSARLWDADSEKDGKVTILLSALNVPASKEDVEKWGSGVELVISNNGTALTIGSKEVIFEDTHHILKATEYTNFTLSWRENMLVLGKQGVIKPIYIAEMDNIGSMIKHKNSTFNYYSVTGSYAMWEFPFCDDEFVCEEHTTFITNFTVSWPLRQVNMIYDLQFFVRSFRSAVVSLTLNPYYEFPKVLITIGEPDNKTRVEYKVDSQKTILLVEETYGNILSYYEWSEIHVTMFAQELHMLRKVDSHLETVLKARHEVMSSLRWFSIGSDFSTTHWALFCQPQGMTPAYPPECVLYENDAGYVGTQAVTSMGYPCVPWIDDRLVPADTHTSSHHHEHNENYCRNINKKPSGPWCYALTDSGVKEQDCHVRRCSAMDCKVAGTANDYLGQLAVTRSNRICQHWSSVPKSDMPSSLHNKTLFPESSVSKAENYCRNPSRSLAGTQVRGAEGVTATYKAIWKLDETKKMEVALKTLVREKTDTHLKDFIELANKWAGVQSSSVVRLYGVTLMSPSALVMEYLQYGPLDVYLSERGEHVQPIHLMMGAAGLARALLDLSEAGCVHGRLRCSKVLLAHHDKDKFTVKLSDPGLHSYTEDDIHWIPVEFYSDLNLARRSSTADVWAFGTTLWEMFSYGLSPTQTNPVLRQKGYEQGHRLSCPAQCPREVWSVILECWPADPHRRAIPQVIMRDISHLLDRESICSTNTYETLLDPDVDIYTGSGDETVSSEWMFPNAQPDNTSDKSRVTADSSISFPSTSVITIPEYDEGADGRFAYDADRFTPLEPHSMQWILGMGPKCNVTLQKTIGAGNYGEVYMGYLEREDLSHPLQVVAVKKLKSNGDQGTLNDFRKEIEVMKSLQHPNIVEILGVCEERDMLIVMQYLEHGALSSYLKIYRDKLQHRDLLKYALDVASGMDYLSAKHLVHRDLAARNILVKDSGNVKISDFGLARFTTDNDKYRMKTMRDLPLNWYSPEAATQGEFSSASDVWSYGVTLWETFTYCLREVPKFDVKAPKKRADCFAMPDDCPAEVYRRLMTPCWNYLPADRPKFIQLVHTCKQLLLQY